MEEVISIFADLGWSCSKDEVGDFFCLMERDGKLIQIIPSFSKRADHFRVSLMPSISTIEFSNAAAFIKGEEAGFEPIIVSSFPVEKLQSLERNNIERLSKTVLDWVCDQNMSAGLEEYRNLPTNAKGARPLRHLASLVLAGDIAVLERYEKSFERGDKLGFVPYITTDMISRALVLSRSYSSHGLD